jgi:hypothetical protein
MLRDLLTQVSAKKFGYWFWIPQSMSQDPTALANLDVRAIKNEPKGVVAEGLYPQLQPLHLKKKLKLVEQAPAIYLKFDVFWIYMLWGIWNQQPKNFARTFGLTSPSAWCAVLTGYWRNIVNETE